MRRAFIKSTALVTAASQMTNFGAHNLDIVRRAMNVKAPTGVAGFGGRYAVEIGVGSI